MAFVYSCCFWFSLRLGGIIIAAFSLIQDVAVLITLCVIQSNPQGIKDEITSWVNNFNLIYTKDYLLYIRDDPEKYCVMGICVTILYMAVTMLYIHGAFKCKNSLMMGYILLELFKLIFLSCLISTWLIVLKKNIMDIGVLVGASVACGFLLLGMFYLWVCAANLPILISEMEKDAHAATLARLQQLLQTDNRAFPLDTVPLADSIGDAYSKDVFVLPRNNHALDKPKPIKGNFIPYYR